MKDNNKMVNANVDGNKKFCFSNNLVVVIYTYLSLYKRKI